MEHLLDWIFLIIVYTVLNSVNINAVVLYRMAFYKMKRTRMIKSVYYLLGALLFENLFFSLSIILRLCSSGEPTFLELPYIWAIPKIILTIGLIYFINTSQSPTEQIKKKDGF